MFPDRRNGSAGHVSIRLEKLSFTIIPSLRNYCKDATVDSKSLEVMKTKNCIRNDYKTFGEQLLDLGM